MMLWYSKSFLWLKSFQVYKSETFGVRPSYTDKLVTANYNADTMKMVGSEECSRMLCILQ